MANEQLISEIVSPKAQEQVTKLTSDLSKANLEMQKAIITAKEYNDTLSGAKTLSDINKATAAAEKQQQILAKATASRQLQEERLAAFRAQEQSKAEARARKEEESLARIEQANNKAAESAIRRAAEISKQTDKIIAEGERERQSILKTEAQRQAKRSVITESTPQDIIRSNGGVSVDAGKTNAAFTAYLREVKKDFDSGKISAREYVDELERYAEASTKSHNKSSSSLVTNTAATKGNSKAKSAAILTEAQATAATAANNAAIKRQAVEMIAAKGSLDQRQAALTRLTAAYAALNAAERQQAFGIRLGTRILPGLNAQVSALKATTTGAAASTSLLSGSFGALKTLANILPGIGIAGLIAFATGPIVEYIGKLDLFKKKASEAKLSQDEINKALQGSEYTDAVKNVNELRINIDAARKGFVDKGDVLRQYNETIGKTTGQVKSLDEAERELNKNADAFIKFTLYKAAAQLALEDASKKSYEAEISRRKKIEEFSSINENFGPGNLEGIDTRTGEVDFKKRAERQKRIIKLRADRQAAEVKISEDEGKKLLNIADKFQKDALNIAKSNGFTNPLGLREEKSSTKKVESDARKQAASLIQIQIDSLKEAQDYYKQNSDNQQFSLDARLDGLKNYSDVALEIVRLDGEREKAAKKLTSNEILAIDADTANKQNKIRSDQYDRANIIARESLARTKGIIAEQAAKDLTATEKLRDDELSALTDRLNKGQISTIEYDKKRSEIEEKYTEKYISLQIEQTQAYIDAAKLRGENTESEEAKLAAIKLRYGQIAVDRQKRWNNELSEEADDLLQKDIERAEAVKQITQELFDFGKALGDATFTRRINGLEKEKAALTERTNLEIANVQASTATEQEKADRISVINAKAASDQAVLDERVRQQKIKQAKFDKAAAIAQIIIQTALAQIKIIGETGLLGFVFSPLVTALGAISLATAIATPIPEYKTGKGRGDNYSGPAIVGDGGMSELVIEPDGRMYVTPDKPTMTTVSAGTQIVSGPEFKRMLASPNITHNVEGKYVDISRLVQSNDRMGDRVEKAIGKQKINAYIETEKGRIRRQQSVTKHNNWISRNFRR